MTNFQIEFTSKETDYTADVHKVPLVNNIPVQYHVSDIDPVIPGLPLPVIFLHSPERSEFTYGFFENDPELLHKMFMAIKKYCIDNGISLTGN